ncbi:MAG: hypothetical protein AAGE93_04645 [Bacteroidota bacterium]
MKLTMKKKPKRRWAEKLGDQMEREPIKYVLPLLIFVGVVILAEQYWEKLARLD